MGMIRGGPAGVVEKGGDEWWTNGIEAEPVTRDGPCAGLDDGICCCMILEGMAAKIEIKSFGAQ